MKLLCIAYFSRLKVSESQKPIFLKLHCPKNDRIFRQNSALWSYSDNSIKSTVLMPFRQYVLALCCRFGLRIVILNRAIRVGLKYFVHFWAMESRGKLFWDLVTFRNLSIFRKWNMTSLTLKSWLSKLRPIWQKQSQACRNRGGRG